MVRKVAQSLHTQPDTKTHHITELIGISILIIKTSEQMFCLYREQIITEIK